VPDLLVPRVQRVGDRALTEAGGARELAVLALHSDTHVSPPLGMTAELDEQVGDSREGAHDHDRPP
jgi:hypothetical protein